jgi:hypothetical protein
MAACVSETLSQFVNEDDWRGGRKAFAGCIAHMNNGYDELLTDIVVMPSAYGTRAAAQFIVNGA